MYKAFANNSSANIILFKTQLSKIAQVGRFLGKGLGPLLKTGLPLMKNIIKIVKSLEKSGLLKKAVSKTIENKSKE